MKFQKFFLISSAAFFALISSAVADIDYDRVREIDTQLGKLETQSRKLETKAERKDLKARNARANCNYAREGKKIAAMRDYDNQNATVEAQIRDLKAEKNAILNPKPESKPSDDNDQNTHDRNESHEGRFTIDGVEYIITGMTGDFQVHTKGSGGYGGSGQGKGDYQPREYSQNNGSNDGNVENGDNQNGDNEGNVHNDPAPRKGGSGQGKGGSGQGKGGSGQGKGTVVVEKKPDPKPGINNRDNNGNNSSPTKPGVNDRDNGHPTKPGSGQGKGGSGQGKGTISKKTDADREWEETQNRLRARKKAKDENDKKLETERDRKDQEKTVVKEKEDRVKTAVETEVKRQDAFEKAVNACAAKIDVINDTHTYKERTSIINKIFQGSKANTRNLVKVVDCEGELRKAKVKIKADGRHSGEDVYRVFDWSKKNPGEMAGFTDPVKATAIDKKIYEERGDGDKWQKREDIKNEMLRLKAMSEAL